MSSETKRGPAYVIVYAAVISAVFTGAIMTLHGASRNMVERNQDLFRQKAFVELFGLGDVDTLSDREIVELYDSRIQSFPQARDPQTGQVFEYYAATDAAGSLTGYAFSVSGTGFWARIDGYLAVSPDFTKITGITFLEHQETPGLGGRITERPWREKFAGLDFTLNPDGQVIYIGGPSPEPGSPRVGRHVDAISGATGTSGAVERFLNEQIAAFRRTEPALLILIKIPY